MRHVFLAGFLYLAAVLQTTWAGVVAIGPATPWLLPLVVVAALSWCGHRTSLLWALAAGLTGDCLAAGALGPEALACVVTCIFLRQTLPVERGEPVARFVVRCWLGTTLVIAIALILRFARHASSVPWLDIGEAAIAGGFYTAIIGLILVMSGRLLARVRLFRRSAPEGRAAGRLRWAR